jgi:hypothetical protein
VSASRLRRLACSLAVLAAVAQLPASAVLAGALHLMIAPHGHSLSVQVDDGHVDLVLSHQQQEARRSHGSESHLHALAGAEGSHVVHLASDDAARDSVRRSGSIHAPLASVPSLAHRSSREPAASAAPVRSPVFSSPLLKTIVLRI